MSNSPTTRPETANATKTDVQLVGFIASTTAFVAWLAKRVWFPSGELPIEISGMIQYGVPLAVSGIATEWRWRMAKRRAKTPPDPAGK
ncbi:hypothetical protein GA0115240_105827 [Streptomyces sp. DvalAA-14]|uniref:hypothetical protein n=1 Tax=unclassified Streptomyces TaxID=2593676 RepID=UPI00081B8571|nr:MULTISPECIES: hypothetical protein [unclassified Streptomyces]MYS19174.1 hypothetical protein [Streptomyces sp. SID4948]SCD38331.1 hypothetical protein GA0115240_105827 [Streptomyces sp. DvalAA-14]